METSLGVFPVFDLKFALSITGKLAELPNNLDAMKVVAEMETFEPSIEGNVEEWTPMETEGWVRRLMTGKGFSIALSGKRHEGDPGNDYVFGLSMATGREASSTAAIEFPNGDILAFHCVVNVTKNFGGDSVNVSGLEFELMSDGKPEYISAGTGGTA